MAINVAFSIAEFKTKWNQFLLSNFYVPITALH